METFLSVNVLPLSTFHVFPSTSSFHPPSFIPQKPLSLRFSHRKQICNSKKPIFISSASNLGGWDDLEFSSTSEDCSSSGEFERFRNFLISIGIDDRKHVYMFFAGFASALAVSRVRFSSIAVFPASVLVFIVGFSVGIVRGARVGRSGSLGLETHSGVRISAEKFRKLRDFFSDLEVKMSDLKIGIEGAIDSNSIEIGEIKRYREIVESTKSGIMSAKSVIGTLFGGDNLLLESEGQMGILHNVRNSGDDRVGEQEVERNLNQKSSRRKRDLGVMGFDIFQFLIGGLFQEISVGLKSHKVKEANKQESKEQLNSVHENDKIIDNGRNGSILASKKIERESSNPASKDILGKQAMNQSPQQNTVRLNENRRILSDPKMEPSHTDDFDESGQKTNKAKVFSEKVNRNSPGMEDSNKMIKGRPFDDHMFSFDSGLDTRINGLHSAKELRNFQKQGPRNQGEAQELNGEVSDSAVLGICEESGTCSQGLKEEVAKTMKLEEKTILNNHRYVSNNEQAEASSSSAILDDEFNRHLKKANGLLRQAREYLMVKVDDEMAEILLCKSASLLSRALQMKPTSLQAVGQLGNTFLLHGELKLKRSRELRALLSKSDYSTNGKESRTQPQRLRCEALNKDKVASVLVDVCEECEELLIGAGRKYRMALSIDGDDVRALYNWGLALTFRAQLIADVGSEAALDADKVYLAAIDKFDAMVSKSNDYAPKALFRWGVALQLRSHLRPSSSTEKLKLLQQAKRLLEDALYMGSNNPQVREALSSCVLEMNCSKLL